LHCRFAFFQPLSQQQRQPQLPRLASPTPIITTLITRPIITANIGGTITRLTRRSRSEEEIEHTGFDPPAILKAKGPRLFIGALFSFWLRRVLNKT
jgi:hypothetical protein